MRVDKELNSVRRSCLLLATMPLPASLPLFPSKTTVAMPRVALFATAVLQSKSNDCYMFTVPFRPDAIHSYRTMHRAFPSRICLPNMCLTEGGDEPVNVSHARMGWILEGRRT